MSQLALLANGSFILAVGPRRRDYLPHSPLPKCGAASGHRAMYSQKRILVVEDDPVVARMIQMAMTVDGHSVQVAKDSDEAIATLSNTEFDVVFTDFRLLGSMDGLELAEAIKQQRPALPIVLITAYADRIQSAMGQVSNVDVLLKKPASVMDLHKALNQLFPDDVSSSGG